MNQEKLDKFIKNSPFEIFGFTKDYYVDRKYIGSEKMERPDRDMMGYAGRQYHTSTEKMVFGKKSINKGVEYYTEVVALCGRLKKMSNEA